jgi:rod shape-determining protein MreC
LLALLKRFKEFIAVAALVVVPLAVYFAHARHPSDRTFSDRVVLAVTSPIEKAIDWTVTGALSTWSRYARLRGIRERAEALSREVNRLKRETDSLRELRSENARLERLLGFARSREGERMVGARVIGTRMDPKGLQLVTIDRGAEDGLKRMMPVVNADGVVGRIHTLSAHSADVLLLIDRNSSVAVRVDRSRARANVRGQGGPGPCRLEYALRSDDLIEGDLLVTSGTDGVFPRGLPVGKATKVRRAGYGLYQAAEVVPAADVSKLEEILVLVATQPAPESAPAAQAPSP